MILKDLLALIFFSILLIIIHQYSQTSESERGYIILKATTIESPIDIHRLKIRIDENGTYISILYNSDLKAKFYLNGYTCSTCIRNIYIKSTEDYSRDLSEYSDLINTQKLGQCLEKSIWKSWLGSDYIVIPENIEISKKKIELNNSSNEIIFEFDTFDVRRKMYLLTDIGNYNEDIFPTILNIEDSYMVINIPIYTKSYTEKVYLFEEEKLRTTIEIINKKWYDKFHLTLFATLSAIVFFIYSLYLSIISQNEIKVTIKEDLKKNSERIIDLGNKINDMDTKISNFLKKQIDKKPSKLRKSRK